MQPRRLRAGARIAAALALLALVGNAAGCGSRCAEVAAARDELRSRRGDEHRGADVRITLPLARINERISAIRLSVGARTFEARVTDAALSAEAPRFALRLRLATD